MRLHCFILSEACSCTLELAYFAGKIAKNRLVCKNAVALAYYERCRLLVVGSCRYLEQIMSADKYPSIFSRQMEAIVYIFSRQLEAIVYIFPNFQNCARCVKDVKDNKENSLHLGRKYARIFVQMEAIWRIFVQMEAIVYILGTTPRVQHAVLLQPYFSDPHCTKRQLKIAGHGSVFLLGSNWAVWFLAC